MAQSSFHPSNGWPGSPAHEHQDAFFVSHVAGLARICMCAAADDGLYYLFEPVAWHKQDYHDLKCGGKGWLLDVLFASQQDDGNNDRLLTLVQEKLVLRYWDIESVINHHGRIQYQAQKRRMERSGSATTCTSIQVPWPSNIAAQPFTMRDVKLFIDDSSFESAVDMLAYIAARLAMYAPYAPGKLGSITSAINACVKLIIWLPMLTTQQCITPGPTKMEEVFQMQQYMGRDARPPPDIVQETAVLAHRRLDELLMWLRGTTPPPEHAALWSCITSMVHYTTTSTMYANHMLRFAPPHDRLFAQFDRRLVKALVRRLRDHWDDDLCWCAMFGILSPFTRDVREGLALLDAEDFMLLVHAAVGLLEAALVYPVAIPQGVFYILQMVVFEADLDGPTRTSVSARLVHVLCQLLKKMPKCALANDPFPVGGYDLYQIVLGPLAEVVNKPWVLWVPMHGHVGILAVVLERWMDVLLMSMRDPHDGMPPVYRRHVGVMALKELLNILQYAKGTGAVSYNTRENNFDWDSLLSPPLAPPPSARHSKTLWQAIDRANIVPRLINMAKRIFPQLCLPIRRSDPNALVLDVKDKVLVQDPRSVVDPSNDVWGLAVGVVISMLLQRNALDSAQDDAPALSPRMQASLGYAQNLLHTLHVRLGLPNPSEYKWRLPVCISGEMPDGFYVLCGMTRVWVLLHAPSRCPGSSQRWC